MEIYLKAGKNLPEDLEEKMEIFFTAFPNDVAEELLKVEFPEWKEEISKYNSKAKATLYQKIE